MTHKKLVYGVGINDVDYLLHVRECAVDDNGKQIRKLVWRCPIYTAWTNMLRRCYDAAYQERFPTYKGVGVCSEWFVFSKFREWMLKQNFDGKVLDKDILSCNDLKIYSPSTCCFVSNRVNVFLTERESRRGLFPLGVHFDKTKGKFEAACSDPFTKKRVRLGRFDCPKEAHKAWAEYKLGLAIKLSLEIEDKHVACTFISVYQNLLKEAEVNIMGSLNND